MACCKCCRATKGNQKCWAILLFIFAIIALIGAMMTNGAATEISDNLLVRFAVLAPRSMPSCV